MIQTLYKQTLMPNHTRMWCAMGFNLFEYNRELAEWIGRHKDYVCLDNMSKRAPVWLQVAHIYEVMQDFVLSARKSPHYGKYKNIIDREIDDTIKLGTKFGIHLSGEVAEMGAKPEET